MEGFFSLDKLAFFAAQGFLAFYSFGVYGRSRSLLEGWSRDLQEFRTALRERPESWLDVIRDECASHADTIVAARYSTLTMGFRVGAVPYDQSALDDALADRADESYAPLRRVAQVAVLIGLLGTLFGLTLGVSRVPVLRVADEQSLDSVLAQMSSVISGFGGAFLSAFVGVLVAIVATVLSGLLDGRASVVLREFRSFAREVLLEAAAHRAGATSLPDAVQQLTKTLGTTGKGFPAALQTANETVASAASSIAALEDATHKMAAASANFATDLASTGVLADSLARFQKIVDDHSKETRDIVERIEQTVEGTMAAIVDMQRSQIELAESLNRMVIDRPMEVASSRLLVGDREEFRRMRALVESIDVKSRAISTALGEVVAESERNAPMTRRFSDWVKTRSGKG